MAPIATARLGQPIIAVTLHTACMCVCVLCLLVKLLCVCVCVSSACWWNSCVCVSSACW